MILFSIDSKLGNDEKCDNNKSENNSSVISNEENQQEKKGITIRENGEWECPMCGAPNNLKDKKCYCGYVVQ